MKSRRWIFWLAIAGAVALYAVFLELRLGYLRRTGQRVDWLAELWAPTGFLALVVVTFVERMVGKPKSGGRGR